jgi:hypothetical protein
MNCQNYRDARFVVRYPIGSYRKSMVIEVEQQDDVCVMRVEGSLTTGSDPESLSVAADRLKRLKP